MKCFDAGCSAPQRAEWVKIGSDQEACDKHLPPEARDLLDLDVETAGGWTHTDAAWFCGSCRTYQPDQANEGMECVQCSQRSCDGCLNEDLVCQGCRERNDERADVLGVIGGA